VADVQEALARGLHEAYVRQRLAAGEHLDATPSLTGWDELPEEFKQSSRRSAQDMSSVVGSLGYELRPASGTETGRLLTEDEVTLLAERMHQLWVAEREASGWRVGARRDDEERRHPDLVSWDDLPEERREIDRHLLRELPGLLREVGLVLGR
jgi:hypothetical protein